MSKCVITIEDQPGNRVKVTCVPTGETLIKKHVSGHDLTSAEAYALFALRQLREESKRKTSNIIVPIPRIGRP